MFLSPPARSQYSVLVGFARHPGVFQNGGRGASEIQVFVHPKRKQLNPDTRSFEGNPGAAGPRPAGLHYPGARRAFRGWGWGGGWGGRYPYRFGYTEGATQRPLSRGPHVGARGAPKVSAKRHCPGLRGPSDGGGGGGRLRRDSPALVRESERVIARVNSSTSTRGMTVPSARWPLPPNGQFLVTTSADDTATQRSCKTGL